MKRRFEDLLTHINGVIHFTCNLNDDEDSPELKTEEIWLFSGVETTRYLRENLILLRLCIMNPQWKKRIPLKDLKELKVFLEKKDRKFFITNFNRSRKEGILQEIDHRICEHDLKSNFWKRRWFARSTLTNILKKDQFFRLSSTRKCLVLLYEDSGKVKFMKFKECKENEVIGKKLKERSENRIQRILTSHRLGVVTLLSLCLDRACKSSARNHIEEKLMYLTLLEEKLRNLGQTRVDNDIMKVLNRIFRIFIQLNFYENDEIRESTSRTLIVAMQKYPINSLSKLVVNSLRRSQLKTMEQIIFFQNIVKSLLENEEYERCVNLCEEFIQGDQMKNIFVCHFEVLISVLTNLEMKNECKELKEMKEKALDDYLLYLEKLEKEDVEFKKINHEIVTLKSNYFGDFDKSQKEWIATLKLIIQLFWKENINGVIDVLSSGEFTSDFALQLIEFFTCVYWVKDVQNPTNNDICVGLNDLMDLLNSFPFVKRSCEWLRNDVCKEIFVKFLLCRNLPENEALSVSKIVISIFSVWGFVDFEFDARGFFLLNGVECYSSLELQFFQQYFAQNKPEGEYGIFNDIAEHFLELIKNNRETSKLGTLCTVFHDVQIQYLSPVMCEKIVEELQNDVYLRSDSSPPVFKILARLLLSNLTSQTVESVWSKMKKFTEDEIRRLRKLELLQIISSVVCDLGKDECEIVGNQIMEFVRSSRDNEEVINSSRLLQNIIEFGILEDTREKYLKVLVGTWIGNDSQDFRKELQKDIGEYFFMLANQSDSLIDLVFQELLEIRKTPHGRKSSNFERINNMLVRLCLLEDCSEKNLKEFCKNISEDITKSKTYLENNRRSVEKCAEELYFGVLLGRFHIGELKEIYSHSKKISLEQANAKIGERIDDLIRSVEGENCELCDIQMLQCVLLSQYCSKNDCQRIVSTLLRLVIHKRKFEVSVISTLKIVFHRKFCAGKLRLKILFNVLSLLFFGSRKNKNMYINCLHSMWDFYEQKAKNGIILLLKLLSKLFLPMCRDVSGRVSELFISNSKIGLPMKVASEAFSCLISVTEGFESLFGGKEFKLDGFGGKLSKVVVSSTDMILQLTDAIPKKNT